MPARSGTMLASAFWKKGGCTLQTDNSKPGIRAYAAIRRDFTDDDQAQIWFARPEIGWIRSATTIRICIGP